MNTPEHPKVTEFDIIVRKAKKLAGVATKTHISHEKHTKTQNLRKNWVQISPRCVFMVE